MVVNFLEPVPGDTHVHKPLDIAGLLDRVTRFELRHYGLYHGRSHLVAYEPRPPAGAARLRSLAVRNGAGLRGAVSSRLPNIGADVGSARHVGRVETPLLPVSGLDPHRSLHHNHGVVGNSAAQIGVLDHSTTVASNLDRAGHRTGISGELFNGRRDRTNGSDGRPLVFSPRDKERSVPAPAVREGAPPRLVGAALGVDQDDQAQYIDWHGAQGEIVFRELYDLVADPFQLNNTLVGVDPNRPDVVWMSAFLAHHRTCRGTTLPTAASEALHERAVSRQRTSPSTKATSNTLS